jgi:hypothetical protein
VFADINTGEIDLTGSTAGTFTVTNTITVAGCPPSTHSEIMGLALVHHNQGFTGIAIKTLQGPVMVVIFLFSTILVHVYQLHPAFLRMFSSLCSFSESATATQDVVIIA